MRSVACSVMPVRRICGSMPRELSIHDPTRPFGIITIDFTSRVHSARGRFPGELLVVVGLKSTLALARRDALLQPA